MPSYHRAFRLGFIPLLDAAPLVAAVELGICARYDLEVRLERAPGWATVRDRFMFGEWDGCQALAGEALAIAAQPTSRLQRGVSPFFLNRGGSYLMLARRWTDRGIRTARQLAAAAEFAGSGQRLVLGVVGSLASHRFLLDEWLEETSGVSRIKAEVILLPPSLLARNLGGGHLDGICVGEPWNTYCAMQKWGEIVASGESLVPDHPDKLFLLSARLVRERPEECAALCAALMEGAQWCGNPDNHIALAEMMGQRPYLGVSAECALASLRCEHTGTHSSSLRFDDEAMHPNASRLAWLVKHFRRCDLPGAGEAARVFDLALFHAARALREEARRPMNRSHDLNDGEASSKPSPRRRVARTKH